MPDSRTSRSKLTVWAFDVLPFLWPVLLVPAFRRAMEAELEYRQEHGWNA